MPGRGRGRLRLDQREHLLDEESQFKKELYFVPRGVKNDMDGQNNILPVTQHAVPLYVSTKRVIGTDLETAERQNSISEELPPDDSVYFPSNNNDQFPSNLAFSKRIIIRPVKATSKSESDEESPSAHASPSSPVNSSQSYKEFPSNSSNEVLNISSEVDETDPLAVFKDALIYKGRSFIIIAAEFLTNENTTEELVNDWIQFVMRRCLTSDVFCDTFASYFKTLIHHKTYGRMIRNVTIDNLQELYEERHTSIDDKPGDFCGSINLLGQIFLRYKIHGEPFRTAAQPLLECLLMILNSPDEETIKIVAKQVSLNGKALQHIEPETMMQLIVTTQRQLLDTTSDTLRPWLLLITNLCFYGQPLSPAISEVFATTIGIHTINQMAPPNEEELYGELPEEFKEKYGDLFPE